MLSYFEWILNLNSISEYQLVKGAVNRWPRVSSWGVRLLLAWLTFSVVNSIYIFCIEMALTELTIKASYLTEPLAGPYKVSFSMNMTDSQSPFRMEALSEGDRNQLIDMKNFKFVMNDVAFKLNSSDTFIFALVHSAPCHTSQRMLIRNTWGKYIKAVFLVGLTDNDCQFKLQLENSYYSDIVQGSFVDSYGNLTYKHVMGFKWVTYYHPTVKYILKTDDDVMVNSTNLFKFIDLKLSKFGARHLIMCSVNFKAPVQRSYRSKWRIPPKLYPHRYFPNYCDGYAVMYSPDVVFLLYQEAQVSHYFWIDDVHVTGTLVEQANLSLTDFRRFRDSLWTLTPS